MAIDTDKNTIFNDHTYKTDIGQHFHKSEKIRQGGATVTKLIKLKLEQIQNFNYFHSK